jgi:hypothetical protein
MISDVTPERPGYTRAMDNADFARAEPRARRFLPFRFAVFAALLIAAPAAAQPLKGLLENPANGSVVSGIGTISGWVCAADDVVVLINDTVAPQIAYGTNRGDTQGACGDTNNGFGALFNWNLLGDGTHTLVATVDGVELARATFRVQTLGVSFLSDKEGVYLVEDFPEEGDSFGLQWEQAAQNFMIVPPPANGTPVEDASSASAIEGPAATVLGVLENPSDNGRSSGIGLASGWVCDADEVEIVIDGTIRLQAAYPTARADTVDECAGSFATGFGVLFNWNLLSNGPHTAVALADGMEFDRSEFRVRKLGGSFLRGLDKTLVLPNFPTNATDVEVEWVEASQNFLISDVLGIIPTPTPVPTQTPKPTAPRTPTPTPSPKPQGTPPVPSGCPAGAIPNGGDNVPGIVPRDPLEPSGIRIPENERRVYCATLPSSARQVRFFADALCSSDVELTVRPSVTTFSDGSPLTVKQTRGGNVSYGSLTRPPGYVPAQVFYVDVLGFENADTCNQNGRVGARIQLGWVYDE